MYALADMPTREQGRGRVRHVVHPVELCRLLRPCAGSIALAVVEAVAARPGQGVAGVFSFGHSAGAVAGALAGLGHHLPPCHPAVLEARRRPGVRR